MRQRDLQTKDNSACTTLEQKNRTCIFAFGVFLHLEQKQNSQESPVKLRDIYFTPAIFRLDLQANFLQPAKKKNFKNQNAKKSSYMT